MRGNMFLKHHGATILSVLGVIGVVATAVIAARAAPTVRDGLEDASRDKGEELTTLEVAQVVIPTCVPPVLMCTGTIACILGANMLNRKQQASLMSAYALVSNSYKEYRAKLIELYGKETHDRIMDELVVEHTKQPYIFSGGLCDVISLTDGEQCGEKRLFYDSFGHRYFEATLEQVISAEYHLNRNYVLRTSALLNEFYDFLGLSQTDYGSEVGWIITDDSELYWIDFNHRKVTMEDGLECTIIESPVEPSTEWGEYI